MTNSSELPKCKKISQINLSWQRDLVLVSKNIPVWLFQLSETYDREIKTLDQIPEETLKELSDFGFSGLWIVGIWQRSPASQKIKHLYGNDQLIASAYSIYEYKIADELGGESALEILKNKALHANLFLACDMVPNHTALDSPWLINHPDWFVQTEIKPSNNWTFDSPDLCPDPSVAIHLEEGYYTQTGAAEVFQFKQKADTNQIYIYHGNDGSSMPWNDTAQLNYLNPETREAMKAEIIRAAKNFNIIRLDAAMTLLKKHFKRLWFPDPGSNEYIPTRESYSLMPSEFDALMPNEFWCEVLKAVAQEAPDTLFIAEAFWMMEKYFVKTLGMHRVYNSAFLNQLKDEKNCEFRVYMKEILKNGRSLLDSFVNYLTTPDENPASLSFGKGMKYFGTCGLMASLPGLPLFGHGQIEGFSEHYRMDYSKPFLHEIPDEEFIYKHSLMITPLLKQRSRFASSENLKMLEFFIEPSVINENVIIFSNSVNDFQSLIIFNNLNENTTGKILFSDCETKDQGSFILQFQHKKGSSQVTFKEIRFGEKWKKNMHELMAEGLTLNLKPYEFCVYDVS